MSEKRSGTVNTVVTVPVLWVRSGTVNTVVTVPVLWVRSGTVNTVVTVPVLWVRSGTVNTVVTVPCPTPLVLIWLNPTCYLCCQIVDGNSNPTGIDF